MMISQNGVTPAWGNPQSSKNGAIYITKNLLVLKEDELKEFANDANKFFLPNVSHEEVADALISLGIKYRQHIQSNRIQATMRSVLLTRKYMEYEQYFEQYKPFSKVDNLNPRALRIGVTFGNWNWPFAHLEENDLIHHFEELGAIHVARKGKKYVDKTNGLWNARFFFPAMSLQELEAFFSMLVIILH